MANKYLLQFERPLMELEQEIEATKLTALERGIDMSGEIEVLQAKLDREAKSFYQNLTRWQRVQMARHPERPYTLDYVKGITDWSFELHGDRHYADDKAVVGGLAEIDGERVIFIGQQKGRGTRDNVYRNFGMPNPEGYRKAMRLMGLGAKFKRPVISFIDTPGAYPGIGAEERGQAQAIAQNLMFMSTLPVPVIVIVIGEGASGGALGMGVGDRLIMLENTWFSVISPEGCASILYRDASKAEEAADAMRVTPKDLVEMGICDRILPEPLGGAHRDVDAMMVTMKQAVLETLAELRDMPADELVAARIRRYEQLGKWQE
ncbi:MAG: acetyl-CoA carboxylase carboxyltransferase subunit alpha [Candidatus Marinimicrobia bacterium]|nr:acetyl-CoA carboxylase carboxyltransferase subunit alpha [Candidatus Neomarinimicrobiota bacterium]